MLPVENAPEIVEAASKVLQGTNHSVYGDGAGVLGQPAPLGGLIGRAVRQDTPSVAEPAPESAITAETDAAFT